MSDDLIERLEAGGIDNVDTLCLEAAARIRQLEQGAVYTGEIEPGMVFVWERGKPHAECVIKVTEVRERENDERAVYSIAKDATQPVWNDESRFREAVRPALTPAPVTDEARENIVDEIEEIIGETHDLDVTDRNYAENIVGWLERHHPTALSALAGQGGEA